MSELKLPMSLTITAADRPADDAHSVEFFRPNDKLSGIMRVKRTMQSKRTVLGSLHREWVPLEACEFAVDMLIATVRDDREYIDFMERDKLKLLEQLQTMKIRAQGEEDLQARYRKRVEELLQEKLQGRLARRRKRASMRRRK